MADAATIIFDLDGTLVDTAPDLTATLNVILERQNGAPVALDDVRHMVGQGARALLKLGLERGGVAAPDALLDRLFDDFIEHYMSRIADLSRPFDGAENVLARCRAAGLRLGLCTNKSYAPTVKLLEQLRLSGYFDAVLGGDSLAVRKPDPAHLITTIEQAGGRRDKAVMVGDSKTDIDAARNAGIPVIAVSFGYTAKPVASFSPDKVIDHLDELYDCLNSLIAR